MDMVLPFKIGKAYFIRTVTYHVVGSVREIVGKFIVLDDAAWVTDSGPFMRAMAEGKLNDVGPVLDGWIVNADAITGAWPWPHKLPSDQK